MELIEAQKQRATEERLVELPQLEAETGKRS